MYQLAFYVPESHAEAVKEAVFQAGAGKIGNYQKCSFDIKGMGQFEPLAGSRPYLGSQGSVEKVPEIKVEMVCSEECLQEAIKALKKAHPYETPAYHVMKTLTY
jgi:structural hemagglutinin/hemolysin toxin protein RtxA